MLSCCVNRRFQPRPLPKSPSFCVLPLSPALVSGFSSPFSVSVSAAHHISTNRVSPFLPLLSFQSLTTIKFSNPLVLTTIRNAGGCGWSPFRSNIQIFKRPRFTNASQPLCSVSAASRVRSEIPPESETPALSERISHLASTSSRKLSAADLCAISFRMNTCETPPKSVHSKRLAQSLSPLESALTKKWGGRGPRFFSSSLQTSAKGLGCIHSIKSHATGTCVSLRQRTAWDTVGLTT